MMSFTHTMTSKGQITVPKDIRRALGLQPGDRASFRIKPSGEVVIERPKTIDEVRQMLKHPAGAELTEKEKLVLEGKRKGDR